MENRVGDPTIGGSAQFADEVFAAELKEIRARRSTLKLDTDAIEKEVPSTEQGLVGLALSGGGIRSATFSLGVIQELAHQNFLRFVDYLSTVSGGGYIGSCLSSQLNDPANKPEDSEFPLAYRAGAAEPPALTHLRNSSNYLSPGGFLEKMRLPNLLLRGILLNILLFLPYVMAAVFITEVAYEKGPHWDGVPKLIVPLLIAFFFLTVAFPLGVRMFRGIFNWRRRNAYELLLTIPMLLVIFLLAIFPVLIIVRYAIEHSSSEILQLILRRSLTWNDLFKPDVIWHWALPLIAIVALFMLAGKASDNLSKLRGKFILVLIGLTGPLVIFAIYLGLVAWQVDSPFLDIGKYSGVVSAAEECRHPKRACDPAKMDEAVKEISDAFENRNVYLDTPRICVLGESKQWGSPTLGIIDSTYQPLEAGCPESDDPSATDEQGYYRIEQVSQRSLRIEGAGLELFDSTGAWYLSRDFHFLLVFILLVLFCHYFLDVNVTSPHGFYRDRLSKAYLFRVDRATGEIVANDRQLLSKLNRPGTSAPYHLINVALNLQAGKDPGLRGRNSDFFFFSKRYLGSDRTGYCKADDMEGLDSHLNLGTAMAISGAAAAPNMGTTTNKALVFVMTLLNIRLGYWLPNPRYVNADIWFKNLRLRGAKSSKIWKEALGLLDSNGSHVNLSDGGHIENLGIYPLMKRRCKYIIAVDAEADPGMNFGGLVALMRYARIDMGIEIHIDLEDIRKNPAGDSTGHWVTGSIDYGDGQTGQLLYIKLSVTGDEPELIRSYREQNSQYPHESTADQFFSEAQFEAYRALGEHICEGVFAEGSAADKFVDDMTCTCTAATPSKINE